MDKILLFYKVISYLVHKHKSLKLCINSPISYTISDKILHLARMFDSDTQLRFYSFTTFLDLYDPPTQQNKNTHLEIKQRENNENGLK